MNVECDLRLSGRGADWGQDERAAKAIIAATLREAADKIEASNHSGGHVTLVDDDDDHPVARGTVYFRIQRDGGW